MTITNSMPAQTPLRDAADDPSIATPRPATVCQVLHSLKVGGAEVLAMRLARRLGLEYRFVFACLDELGTLGEELQAEGFPVHVLKRRPGVDWQCVRRLRRILQMERVDVVHAHQYTPFFYSMASRFLGHRPPILFTEHGRWYPDYPRPKRIVANRLLLGRRDRVVGVGESVRQALIHNEGISASRVRVIYNGIDGSVFDGSVFEGGVSDRSVTRREMGVGPDDLLIIQVARLDALKDHATAIRTLGHVVRRRADVKLVLVGEGPEEAKIREVARREGVEAKIRWLGLRTDVSQLLPAADLFLLTSISEGIPLTLIEAMAAGLPVVSTRVGGVGEVVKEGVTGLLALAGDDDALAEHVLRLAEDPALRDRMGRFGRKRAEAIFSERQMHDRYLEFYGAMLLG